jgi:hypothetical protein
MSWNITVSGTKADSRQSASDQADKYVAAGTMSAAQKAAVLAKIDAQGGPNVSGAVGGGDANTATSDFTGSLKSYS